MILLILLVILVVLLVVLSAVWPPDSPWSPWWKINKEAAIAAGTLANLSEKDLVYELGSGDGEFLLAVSKRFNARCVGIEIDPVRFFISKIRVLLSRGSQHIMLLKQDFKKVDLLAADVVFVYLVPRALERLYPKLKKELKPGSRIISYRYEIPGAKAIKKDTKHSLFLYKV